ncbi:lipolysis-stimulated lipoprotein receptor isoform X5 [Pipistrellus kuhlii]|uniref:lipolysis-stimulated lipoprotein receptor isoform X5 n=1 Tax=Pipistrellus kuhlii TaxID=59472 RepID=UPI001E271E69|nr:lipolysis-stimulated lipoprotein receptor isoform X5 [Pipistrellus kuhlii]
MSPSPPWCAPRPLPSGYPAGDARTGRAQTAAMAPRARGRRWPLGSCPGAPGRGAVVFVWLFLGTLCAAPASAIQVTVSDPYHVVILFQPVTLPCTYQLTTTPTAPIVIWKYKSFCRDRIADAFSPASVDNQLNAQLAAGNPGYNPYVECQDSVRTVRVVATKQGNAVTLGEYYQGRRITITGNADLTFDQTAWGDSGVYYCSVVSAQDLQGNNEAYAELIVLGPHLTPEALAKAQEPCALPAGMAFCGLDSRTSGVAELLPGFQAGPMEVYAAGKAATSGVPSIYAPSTYAYLSPAKTPPPAAVIPMGTVYNGYAGDFDKNSSVGGYSSQVPLLRDADSSVSSEVRSGYRIQASQQDDSMRVLYYMEKELANFDPSRPGPPSSRVERAMSEVTSLHEDDWRSRPSRGPALPPIQDEEWGRHSPRSPRRWEQEPLTERPKSGWGAGRPRARSVDALDDLTRPGSAESGRRSPPNNGKRGRAYAHPRSRSRDDLYDQEDPRGFPHSQEPHFDDFRSRDRPSADPRNRSHRSRDARNERSKDPQYDGRLLEEALRRKGPAERRPYREEEDDYYPPAPPPYSETDSQASRERRLKKNLALSRESLVV